MSPLFKRRDELAELPEDLKKLVEKARSEKKALGEAVKKTEAAAQNFEQITAPLEETKAAIADVLTGTPVSWGSRPYWLFAGRVPTSPYPLADEAPGVPVKTSR